MSDETKTETVGSNGNAFVSIGNQFVFQYYNKLHENPSELHYYFKDDSVFIHGSESDSIADSIRGQENIKQKIGSLGFEKAKVILSVVDVQASVNGGILIVVMGYLSNKGQEFKKFVETFFLALQRQQRSTSSTYYVLNNVFRYVNQDSLDFVPSEQTPPEQENSTETEVLLDTNGLNENTKHTREEKIQEEPKHQIVDAKEKAETVASTTEVKPVESIETKPEPTKTIPVKQSSWASVVTKTSPDTTPEDIQVSKSNNTTPPQNQPKDTKPKDNSVKPIALFVSNIPFESTEAEVIETFSRFGQIKHVDHRGQNGYCFVEFNDPNSVSQALNFVKDNQITMRGRPLSVSERKPKSEAQRKEKKDGKEKKSNGTSKTNFNNGNRDSNAQPKKVAPASKSQPTQKRDGKVSGPKLNSKTAN